MADIDRPTTDATIFDKEGLKAVDVFTDDENINRLYVQSEVEDMWQEQTIDGRGFQVNTGLINVGVSVEYDFMLLRNPVASGKIIKFQDIWVGFGPGAMTLTCFVRVYRNPTITANGTALSVQKIKSDGVPTSVANAYSMPTISARGTLLWTAVIGAGNPEATRSFNLGRYLVEGSDLLITVAPSAKSIDHYSYLSWLEV